MLNILLLLLLLLLLLYCCCYCCCYCFIGYRHLVTNNGQMGPAAQGVVVGDVQLMRKRSRIDTISWLCF